eukprot:UN02001
MKHAANYCDEHLKSFGIDFRMHLRHGMLNECNKKYMLYTTSEKCVSELELRLLNEKWSLEKDNKSRSCISMEKQLNIWLDTIKKKYNKNTLKNL